MAAALRRLFAVRNICRHHVFNQTRNYAATIHCKKLVFTEFGDPAKVVKLEEGDIRYPNIDEVLIEWLVSPMNPADMNTIQGTYPVKPQLPGVPGHEGVGRIVAVGPSVDSFNAGDIVIPNTENLGTWSSHSLTKAENLLKIPNDIPLVELAGIKSNSCTAYRMLKDFVKLEEGDCMIQNGANSAAGQNVVQLCRAWGIKSVNVVRNRPDIDDLKEQLTEQGATFVLTEEELRCTEIFKSGECPQPKLGLNCVGGKSASEVMRKLAPKGVLVTYGGMSREPVIVPTSLFIFKDLTTKGFWMTRWTKSNRDSEERKEMLSELLTLMKEGKLKAPAHVLLPLGDFEKALDRTTNIKGFSGKKMFIDFRIM